ncbi:uncharacterized protein LOC112181067 isoform X1 [Rosa chinensis]|uniref:uncharacterized protein LOC112181067 isoform X1 n=1 Tax=Rosa chinensis TaxID=74649 RepID=UPI000D096F17|nr:uncharacterized protein LOC112181067 isoform X1 [Rosa chinensis]
MDCCILEDGYPLNCKHKGMMKSVFSPLHLQVSIGKSSQERELVIGANGRRRACARRRGPRRRLQGEGVEHERWALLQAQALEAQHGLRHVRSLPHLHSHRHEICRPREAKQRKLLLNVGGSDRYPVFKWLRRLLI